MITEKLIARAAAASACQQALAWLRERPRTVAELATEHLPWWQWAAVTFGLRAPASWRTSDVPQLRYAAGDRAALQGAGLRGADLRWVDFHGAALAKANLSYADLHGAGLRGAGLRGAGLNGADLSGAERRTDDSPIPGWREGLVRS